MPRNLLSSRGLARPSWAWDFTTGKLPSGATFTRATSATYFNSSGVLTSASSGAARFDYAPVTLAPLGYLAETASTNTALRSGDLSNAAWNQQTNIGAPATDGTLAPDGVSLAYRITSTAGGPVYHNLQQVTATAVLLNALYSVSIFVKQGNTRYCTIGDGSAALWHTCTFDFQTGNWIGPGSNSTTEPPRQLLDGWWRLGLNIVSSSNHNVSLGVGFGPNASSASQQNYVAAGTEYGYAWGGQIELGGVGITSLIPTAAATVTRNADTLTLPLLLVPGWDATQGGVLFAAYRLHTLSPTGNLYAAEINDGSANNSARLIVKYTGTATRRTYTTSGGVDQINVGTGVTVAAVFARATGALGWSPYRGFLGYDGNSGGGVNGTFLLPVRPTQIALAAGLNGTLERVAYYRGARPDAFVQTLQGM